MNCIVFALSYLLRFLFFFFAVPNICWLLPSRGRKRYPNGVFCFVCFCRFRRHSLLVCIPFVQYMATWNISADVAALATAEFEVADLEMGTTVTFKWRGKPVCVKRRTEEQIAAEVRSGHHAHHLWQKCRIGRGVTLTNSAVMPIRGWHRNGRYCHRPQPTSYFSRTGAQLFKNLDEKNPDGTLRCPSHQVSVSSCLTCFSGFRVPCP